jgi:hypothetical protein
MFSFFRMKNSQLKQLSFQAKYKVTKPQNMLNIVPTVINEIYEYASDYAAKIIIQRLKAAEQCQYQINEIDEQSIQLTSTNDTYTVGDLSACTCREYNNWLLPCKHIFFCRNLKNIPLFDKTLIINR